MRLQFDAEGRTLSASCALTANVYPGAEVANNDYLDWLYRRNPDGQAVLHGECDETGLRSQFVLTPRRFISSGKTVHGAVSINTITRPDSRGQGLFRRLGTEAFQAVEESPISFIAGFPNRASIGGFTGALGYETVGTLPFLVKPLDWMSFFSNLFSRHKVRKGGDTGFTLSASSVFRGDRWNVAVCHLGDVRLQTLLDAVNAKRTVAGLRMPGFFQWRYADCPTRDYTVLAVSDMKEQEFFAYAVLRGVELMGWKCGAVVDLGCTTTDEAADALRFLLVVAMEKFRQHSCTLAVAACSSGHAEHTALRKAGFYTVPTFLLPQPLHFILKTVPAFTASDSLKDFRNWFLTFGDYDVV